MNRLVFLGIRVVLGLVLAGALFVQVVAVPLAYRGMADAESDVVEVRLPLFAIVVLGLLTVQVVTVCVWRLLTMAARGTVFSSAAFRFVDVIFGAVAVASLLTFGLGVVLAPGDSVAPGIVMIIGGLGVIVAGMALIVLVLRMLLAQAVARDTEAHQLQAELDEVI